MQEGGLEHSNTRRRDDPRQWMVQSDKLRHSLNTSKAWAGWTSQPGFASRGIKVTPRVKDLMDCAVAWHLRNRNLPLWLSEDSKAALSEVFIDVSQNHVRLPWSKLDNVAPCFTRSTCMYSCQRDSVVYPEEMARMMGWPSDMDVPGNVTSQKLKDMVGNSIALPCLGTVVWAWHVVHSSSLASTST